MKHPFIHFAAIFAVFSGFFAHGNTLYVDLNSGNPLSPYSDWSTAATNIQDAIDASTDGDQIWVTNGVYQTGGKVMAGNLTNRVALTKAITVQSVNGPFVTTIAGIGRTNGAIGVRCAWLTNNAALVGFTLTQGATRTTGDTFSLEFGGGVWCASSNATVTGCMIISNTAYVGGGAAYQGSLGNCYVQGNGVSQNASGGAIYSGIVNSCTVVSNGCTGFNGCKATNSICYFNLALNYSGSTSFSYCCVTPAAAGAGNFTNAPVFFDDGIHLTAGSPGVGAGTTTVTGADLFGKTWGTPPTVGCAETVGSPYVSQPRIRLINTPVGFIITGSALGDQPLSYCWLKNGVLLQDSGRVSGTQSTNLIVSGVNLADGANYQLVVNNSFGSVTSSIAPVVVHCVDVAGNNPLAPYTSWETAATNIQDAINASTNGEFVLVTNGVYSTGGKVMVADLTNRVALDKALTVTSVNGYANTVIEGKRDPVSINGLGAVRCAWLTNGAVLNGFMLRNGATRSSTSIDSGYGGGAWLSTNAVISDCVLTNNNAYWAGGGVAFGTVNNCFLTYNAAQKGGGAYQSSLNNCTLRENHCPLAGGDGAGVYSCISRNCIIVDNYQASSGTLDTQLLNYSSSLDKFTNCCTSGLPIRGVNNITGSPLFLNPVGDFHLAPASPCRGTGNPLFTSGTDLDDEPFANPPSMGCDEFILTNMTGPLSVGFVNQYTNYTLVNHSASFRGTVAGLVSELDWNFGDGPTVTNLSMVCNHKWANAGTYNLSLTVYNIYHPLGVSSNLIVVVAPLLPPILQPAGVVSNAFQFSFDTQSNANYVVQYTTNLTPPSWQTLQTFFFSTGGTLTVQDPAVTNGTRFYRVQPQ